MIKYCILKVVILFMPNRKFIEYLRKKGVKIGRGCEISKNVVFGSEPWLISIGNNVRITQNVRFITHDGGLWTLRKMRKIPENSVKFGKIIIGDNCNISWNVIVMPNVIIGRNSIIAAGSIVTKNVPEGEVWGGIPAKKIETIEEYYEKIKNDIVPTYGMSSSEKISYLYKNKPELFVDKISD